jgi:LacI family transcriptional regulator
VIRPQSYELFDSPSGFQTSQQGAVVNAMIDLQVDGLVLVSPLLSIAEFEQVAANVPLVVGHHIRSEEALNTVATDDELGAQPVVDHLMELGHWRIASVMHVGCRGDETRPGVPSPSGL